MYVEQEASFDDKMLTNVGLSRYSGGGYTTLQYHGDTSTVTEYSLASIAKMQSEVNKDVGYESQLAKLNLTLKGPSSPGVGGTQAPPAAEAALVGDEITI